jgi:hypothetical protein
MLGRGSNGIISEEVTIETEDEFDQQKYFSIK